MFCGRADARDDVLALGVDEKFAVELLGAGRGIAGECDPGRGRLAHVAEHHRLNVDGGAPIGGNAIQPPVGDRSRVHPRGEDRPDRAPELILGVLRKRLARRLRDLFLVAGYDLSPIRGAEVGVERQALAVLEILKDALEIVAVDLEHHVRIHLNEAAVAVVGKALVAGGLRQRHHRLVVETEIEHGIHHSRHRRPARPNARKPATGCRDRRTGAPFAALRSQAPCRLRPRVRRGTSSRARRSRCRLRS